MGFDHAGWRIDDTVHPFATRIGRGDVRITTRWDETYFPAGLYGAMHECGHGLYEAGICPTRCAARRSARGESLGMHESQSRHVGEHGRPRPPVLRRPGAPDRRRWSAARLPGLDADALYRAVNRVKPVVHPRRGRRGHVRAAHHPAVRARAGADRRARSPVDDLPEAWNARFKEYLGLDVTNDADGVLQDVHWSAGLIGYFPTYALGNLIAGQLWERAHAQIAGPRRPDRRRRAGPAARMAERARPPSRGEVHNRRAAGARGRRADRPSPRSRATSRQARRRLRPGLLGYAPRAYRAPGVPTGRHAS